MKRLLSAKQVLQLYNGNPNLIGGFGQDFGATCIALDKHPDNPKLASFKYRFLGGHKNIQDTVHGGALATMIDVITTIGILRMTPLRTISISLNTQFLNVIRIGQEVEIDTEVSKIGKNIVFTDCRIFTGPSDRLKLACKGQHVKAVIQQPWNFMKGWQ